MKGKKEVGLAKGMIIDGGDIIGGRAHVALLMSVNPFVHIIETTLYITTKIMICI